MDDYPPGPPRVLELRVHGVSGTPASAMLGVEAHDVRKVAGDHLTGFWRPVPGSRPSGAALPEGGVVEAYSWGALTSSAAGLLGWLRRALWLTLLPFALVNVAMWARPPAPGEPHRREAARWLVRLSGLLLTALMVATVCGLTIDLLAWQCYRSGVPSCPSSPGWVDVLASDTLNDPGRRLAVGQVGPLLVLVALVWLTRTTKLRYEGCFATGGPTPSEGGPHELCDPLTWRGERRLERLTEWHLTVGVCVVVAYTAWPLLDAAQSLAPGGTWPSRVFSGSALDRPAAHAWPLAALLAALALTLYATVSSCLTRQEDTGQERLQRWSRRTARASMVLLLGVHTVVLLWHVGPLPEQGELPGASAFPVVLVLLAYVTTAALVAVSRSSTWVVVALAAAGLVGWASLAPDAGPPTFLRLIAALVGLPLVAVLVHQRRAGRAGPAWYVSVVVAFAAAGVALWVSSRPPLDPPVVGLVLAVAAALALAGALRHRYLRAWSSEGRGSGDGDRAQEAWSVTFGVLVAAGLVAAAATERTDGSRGAANVGTFLMVLLGLGALSLVAAVVHRDLGRREEWAWDGAGPGLLTGAAVTVAVLFSTGITLLVADRLNGDPGVARLDVRQSAVTYAGTIRTSAAPLVQQGWVEVAPAGAVLRRGLVRADTAEDGEGRVTRRVPSGVLGTQVLAVPQGRLRLEGTCVTGETGDRRIGAGSVLLPGLLRDGSARMLVDADTRRPVPPACGTLLSGPARLATSATPVRLTVPVATVWFAAVLPVGLMAAALVVWALRSLLWRRARGAVEEQARELVAGPEAVRRAVRARWAAVLAHRAEGMVAGLAVPTLAVAVVLVAGITSDRPPWQVAGGLHPALTVPVRRVADVGLYVALGLTLLIVGLGARMRRDEGVRRGVGVLWDLTTFWPRSAHPFGPPCYAERVVPEVVQRLRWALAREDGSVVLSAHSQGSTIGVAALLQLWHDPGLRRVHLLTYGSQLRTWFGRIFPAYLGPQVLGHEPTQRPRFDRATPDAPSEPCPAKGHRPKHQFAEDTLAHRLDVQEGGRTRWRNLYRRSDPLGFRVCCDNDEQPADGTWPEPRGNPVDVWVAELPPEDRGDPAPVVATHSGYPDSPQYRALVEAWVGPPR